MSWYAAREKAFSINWHPGPLGHLLLATQLAHYILEEALQALDEEQSPMAPVPKMPEPSGKCGGMARSCLTGMAPHNGPDISTAMKQGYEWKQWTSMNQKGA